MVRDHSEGASPAPRQTERHHAVADRGARLGMTAGADRDILLALPQIGHGIGDAGHRQPALPQLLAGSGVEGAQISIHRAAEGQAARGDGDAVDQRRAPVEGDAERRAILRGADPRAPENFAGLQIDRDHLAPWRLVAQQAQRRERHRARHRKRRALLRSEIMAGRRIETLGLAPRHQFDDVHGAARCWRRGSG